jgi:hypothetical protein
MAVAQGLVKIGQGKTIGYDWVLLADREMPRAAVSLAAKSTTTGPSKTSPLPPFSLPPSTLPKRFAPILSPYTATAYAPLVDFLSSSEPVSQTKAAVCIPLSKRPEIYASAGVEGWKDYQAKALRLGLVEVGPGAKAGCDWIKLAKVHVPHHKRPSALEGVERSSFRAAHIPFVMNCAQLVCMGL